MDEVHGDVMMRAAPGNGEKSKWNTRNWTITISQVIHWMVLSATRLLQSAGERQDADALTFRDSHMYLDR